MLPEGSLKTALRLSAGRAQKHQAILRTNSSLPGKRSILRPDPEQIRTWPPQYLFTPRELQGCLTAGLSLLGSQSGLALGSPMPGCAAYSPPASDPAGGNIFPDRLQDLFHHLFPTRFLKIRDVGQAGCKTSSARHEVPALNGRQHIAFDRLRSVPP